MESSPYMGRFLSKDVSAVPRKAQCPYLIQGLLVLKSKESANSTDNLIVVRIEFFPLARVATVKTYWLYRYWHSLSNVEVLKGAPNWDTLARLEVSELTIAIGCLTCFVFIASNRFFHSNWFFYGVIRYQCIYWHTVTCLIVIGYQC